MADPTSDAKSNDEPLLRLPKGLRTELKEPLGSIYTETDELLREIDEFADRGVPADGDPVLVAVGDVVTAAFLEAGRVPDVAVVDGKTERRDAPSRVQAAIERADGARETADNPAAALTRELLEVLCAGLSSSGPTVVHVRGEEDLAALPAVLAVPVGSSVVYGQPGEGMVHVAVTDEVKADVRRLLTRFEGDVDAALQLLEGDSS